MALSEQYKAQTNLLLQILPVIADTKIFALKGGTAINMFERDLPRLSVDIDLCYPEFTAREEALKAIKTGLQKVKTVVQKQMPHVKVDAALTQIHEYKLFCHTAKAEIKIEVNTTMRGHAFPIRVMPVRQVVQDTFGHFVEMPVVSREELFGGKICAALDRQHPRDLFDVRFLLDYEGISRPITLGFITSICSHNRPLHELLQPNFSEQQETFIAQFAGMTEQIFTYEMYHQTRQQLKEEIIKALLDNDKTFLMSLKQGNPNWELINIPDLKHMPAVLWKLKNIQTLLYDNPRKHAEQLSLLETALE